MLPIEKLDQIIARHAELISKLQTASGSEIANISREFSEIDEVVSKIVIYRKLLDDIEEAETLRSETEFKEIAEEELIILKDKLSESTAELQTALLPKDVDSNRTAILEIRAGTGGEEAALFAGDLFRLYERYAQEKEWTFAPLDSSPTTMGGFREVSIQVKGKGVFSRLKFESGVHRVQRVPVTETSGRIHTSAATVAVLPEPDDVEIQIASSDLQIDTMRSSGAGGQHVNTTDSAVRITHIPSGISVVSSVKSQHRNREMAMKVLKARLFKIERSRVDAKRSANRKAQVGSGDRSERIRTYNFPQGRVTDHRIKLTLYSLTRFMEGDMDEMIDALIAADRASQLSKVDERE